MPRLHERHAENFGGGKRPDQRGAAMGVNNVNPVAPQPTPQPQRQERIAPHAASLADDDPAGPQLVGGITGIFEAIDVRPVPAASQPRGELLDDALRAAGCQIVDNLRDPHDGPFIAKRGRNTR